MDFMSWQLDYLYLLQCFRDSSNHILDSFLATITTFGEIMIPLAVTSIIYWCINKKTGMYLLWCYIVSYIINIALKVTACINRPWLLDSRIKPLACAIPAATGYSFPSGHTAGATSIWGGLGIAMWKNKPIRYLCFTLVLLVMFSRNYLGVHTPQDVIVSFVIGLCVIITIKKVQDSPIKIPDWLWLIIFTTVCITLGIYVCVKPYPCCPLYDPSSIKPDTIGRIGFFLSIAYGWFIEKHFIKFNPKSGTILSRIIKGLLGLIILYGLFLYAKPICTSYMPETIALFCANAVVGLFITAIHPWFIKQVFK